MHDRKTPPGGEGFWEPATDLVAIFLGFGIFLTNSAFSFQQFTGIGTQGWSAQTLGYLSQHENAYALALFCQLKAIDTQLAKRHLKRPLQPFFKKAIKETRTDQQALLSLREIEAPMKK